MSETLEAPPDAPQWTIKRDQVQAYKQDIMKAAAPCVVIFVEEQLADGMVRMTALAGRDTPPDVSQRIAEISQRYSDQVNTHHFAAGSVAREEEF